VEPAVGLLIDLDQGPGHFQGQFEPGQDRLRTPVALVVAHGVVIEIAAQGLGGEGLEGLAAAGHEGAGALEQVRRARPHLVAGGRGQRPPGGVPQTPGHPGRHDGQEVIRGRVPGALLPGPGEDLVDDGLVGPAHIAAPVLGGCLPNVLVEAGGVVVHLHEDDLVVGGGEAPGHGGDPVLTGRGLLGPGGVDIGGHVGDAVGVAPVAPGRLQGLAGVVEGVLQGSDGGGGQVLDGGGEIGGDPGGEPLVNLLAQVLEELALQGAQGLARQGPLAQRPDLAHQGVGHGQGIGAREGPEGGEAVRQGRQHPAGPAAQMGEHGQGVGHAELPQSGAGGAHEAVGHLLRPHQG